MNDRSNGVPLWVLGVIAGILLIVISSRSHLLVPENPLLAQYFAAQPPPAGYDPSFELPQLDIAGLPAELQKQAQAILDTLARGGAARPVEPVATTPRLRVEVRELQRAEGGMKVVGTVTNISQGEVRVPISAFELRDSTGASYVAGGGASATLRPGESTPLELTVPLPEGRGLLLVTNLPPDAPVEQRLLVA